MTKRKFNRNWAIARLKMARNSYEWGSEKFAFRTIHNIIRDMKEAGEF